VTPRTDLWLGSSALARTLAERLARVAQSQATVLLWGEGGTGKGHAAAALHQLSPRAAGPLVATSLAALAPTLIEAELFGHEEGAFTGAARSRLGRFRQAEGGTLVLDDVDTLPLELQGKLLRVLQERVVEPVGAERPVPIDVRVVATSSRNLRELVAAGQFRPDLFWRIAVVELELPPLRARSEDVPELARRRIAALCRERGVPVRELSAAAEASLVAHPWPGNVRELENTLERVFALAPEANGPIEAHELEFLAVALAGQSQEVAQRALSHGLSLEAVERALIETALREQRGNVAAAARQLGLTRRAFDYRVSRLARGEGADV